MPPQQLVRMIKQVVLPSLEAFAKLIDQKKILAGGAYTGARAASNDELDKLLTGLPFWGLVKWTVVPLQPFRDRAAEESRLVEMISARMK